MAAVVYQKLLENESVPNLNYPKLLDEDPPNLINESIPPDNCVNENNYSSSTLSKPDTLDHEENVTVHNNKDLLRLSDFNVQVADNLSSDAAIITVVPEMDTNQLIDAMNNDPTAETNVNEHFNFSDSMSFSEDKHESEFHDESDTADKM